MPKLAQQIPTAELHYQRGIELAKAQRASAAETEFRTAWEQEPGEEKYAYALAVHYIHTHRFARALEIIKDNVERHGPTALGWMLEGELLFEQKQYEPAYECLQNALKISTFNSRAHQLIGLILVVFRRYGNALEELKIAAEQNPESPQVHFYYGRICYKTGNYTQARDEFLTCLRLQSDYPQALENLGLSYEALNEAPKAMEYYRQAIELDKSGKYPPSEDAYVELGMLLAAQGRQQDALRALRDGLSRNPRSARANFELGRVLFQQGEYGEAEKFLLTSSRLDPNFSRPHFFLSRIYQKQNRRKEAFSELSTFRKLDQVAENREARLTR